MKPRSEEHTSEQQIIEEIAGNEYSDHEADIEVCYEHYCCRDDIVELSAVVDEVLNTEDDERQEYRTVYPHGVDELNDYISHHGVHSREYYGLKRSEVFGLLCIDEEGEACCADLGHLHYHNAFKYHFSREKHYDKGEGACKVVSDDTHKSARKVTAPAVKSTSVAPESITESLKVIDILSVQVKCEDRTITKGVYIKIDVGNQCEQKRDEKCSYIVQRQIFDLLTQRKRLNRV